MDITTIQELRRSLAKNSNGPIEELNAQQRIDIPKQEIDMLFLMAEHGDKIIGGENEKV